MCSKLSQNLIWFLATHTSNETKLLLEEKSCSVWQSSFDKSFLTVMGEGSLLLLQRIVGMREKSLNLRMSGLTVIPAKTGISTDSRVEWAIRTASNEWLNSRENGIIIRLQPLSKWCTLRILRDAKKIRLFFLSALKEPATLGNPKRPSLVTNHQQKCFYFFTVIKVLRNHSRQIGGSSQGCCNLSFQATRQPRTRKISVKAVQSTEPATDSEDRERDPPSHEA